MDIPNELIHETIREVVEKFLKPKFIDLGMNASGSWLKALEVRTEQNAGEIYGMSYTEQLSLGRKPGKRPPIDPLIQWVGAKFGLYGKEAVNAAFAISNKIAKEGTKYYPNGTDLLNILESNEVVSFINEKIGGYLIEESKRQMLEMINKIFK